MPSPAREAACAPRNSNRFGVDRSNSRVCYPWAIAPTINTTKLVATAIATFVSTDKFIKFSPFNSGGHLDDHIFFPFGSLRISAC